MARTGRGGGKGGGSARKGGGGSGGASGGSAGGIRAGGAFVELFTKDSQLVKGLKNASKMLKDWGSSIAKSGGIVAGIGAAITAPLTALLTSGIGRAEKIGDVADVFGLTAEQASRMSSAFEIAGGSIDELEKALGKLTKSNVSGKPLDEYLLDVADALGEIDDPTERFRAAAELFGDKFARSFIDTGSDIKGLLAGAPILSKQELDNAKQFRMEWTRIGIVMQDAMLPILQVLKPGLSTVSEFIQRNASILPIVAGVGAAFLTAGAGLIFFGSALTGAGALLGGLATALSVVASPIGLITVGLTAGVLAWANYSESGRNSVDSLTTAAVTSFGEIRDGWNLVTELLQKNEIGMASRVAFATIDLEWQKVVFSMKDVWYTFTKFIKDVFTSASFAIKDAWLSTIDFIAIAMGQVTGGDELSKMLREDAKEAALQRAKDFVGGLEQNQRDKDAAMGPARERLAGAMKEFADAMQAGKDLRNFGGFDFDAGAGAAGLGLGSSTRGASNFGNAGQFFGGSGSVLGKQLREQEKANVKLDELIAAVSGVPLAVFK
jgi:hypothetical protein